MNLEQQLQSLVMSMSYGLFFSLIFNLSYIKLIGLRNPFKIILIVAFLLINATIYFYLLFLVNDGIVHLYFLFVLYIGFLIGNTKTKVFRYKKINVSDK